LTLFDRDDSNGCYELGAEAAPEILSLGCLSPPTPDIAEITVNDIATIYTESLKWYQHHGQTDHTDEKKEEAPGQAEPAAKSIMDDAWCTCLKVDNPAYGLHKLGTCCRGKGRTERGPCKDYWLCTRCADVKPTGGMTTACDALEHGPSTKCFFCKSSGKEIFNDPEHEDAHFPKKPSSINMNTAKGNKRKTVTDFGFCIHRLQMIMGKLDRDDYKAVVEAIDKFNAESKADKEAKERAVTSPEELLSLTPTQSVTADVEGGEDSKRREDPVSDDNDIDDDDLALNELWSKMEIKQLCNLTYKTSYDQLFVTDLLKRLGTPNEWTIHTQANVGDNALSGRWPPTEQVRKEAWSKMKEDGCDSDTMKNLDAEANIPLTQFTAQTAMNLLKKGSPSLIERGHHHKSIEKLRSMSPKDQVSKVYKDIKNWAWTIPAAEVLGSRSAEDMILAAMNEKEPSTVPLRTLAYKFKTDSTEKSTHYVSFFSMLLVDPKSKTAWLISSQNSLEPGKEVEYVKLPLERRPPTLRRSQYIIDREAESKKSSKMKPKKRSVADPNADSAVLMELEQEIMDLDHTVKRRLVYATAHSQQNIIHVIQCLRPKGPEWTIYEAADDGNELDKQWPEDDDKKEIEKWLVENKCDNAADKINFPNMHLAQYASEIASTLLREEMPLPQIAAQIQSRGLQELRAMTPMDQAEKVYNFSKDRDWAFPHVATLGTAKATAEIQQAMESDTTTTSLQIDVAAYRFDREELTNAELLDERTKGFYILVPFFLMVHPIKKTIWLVNGGSQVFKGGDTEYIKLPLELRHPTTSIMQSDIEKKNEFEKQPKTKTQRRIPRKVKTQQPNTQTSKMKNITRKPTAAKARANDKDREPIDLTETETADSSEKPNVQGSVDWTELNENGYVLIKKGVSLGIGILTTIQDELKIVRGLKNNDDTSKDDGKRWQMPFPENSKKENLRLTHEAVMRKLEELTPGLKLGKLLVVGSRKDCAIQKPAHTDTDPSSFEENGKAIPLSIFIGLQKKTTLRIYEGSHRWIRGHDGRSTLHKDDGKQVKYGKGDILILRGDLVHQGDAFQQQNMRLFVYAHLPGHMEELDVDGREIMVTYPVWFDESDTE
jgi:hypothetical protein